AGTLHHRTRELVDHCARIGNDLLAVWAYTTVPVNVPTLLVRIVVPEVEARTQMSISSVWVEKASAFGTTIRQDLDISPPRLNGEVERDVNPSGQRERRAIQRNRCNADLRHYLSVAVIDHRVRRDVQFQAWDQRCTHNCFRHRRGRGCDCVTHVE